MALPERKQAPLIVVLLAMTIGTLATSLVSAADDPPLPAELRQNILLGKYDEALPELQTLAAGGDAEAQYQLALLNLGGTGVERSVPTATKLLRQASEAGHAKAGYLLGTLYFRGKDVPQDTKAAKFYLFSASQQGHQLAGRLLREIDSGAGAPAQSDDRAQKRLMLAARSGHRSRAEDAIRRGARVNLIDHNGESPLMLAIRNRHEIFALWLLDVGARADTQDRSGNTALLESVRAGLGGLSRRLVENGAAVGNANSDGRTPLMEAVNAQEPALVEALLEAGASPDVKDKQGVSARDLAGYRDNKSIKALLARVRSPHRLEGDSAEKLALLRRQVDTQGSLYFGWPLLAAAVAQRDDQTARELLASGSDPWVGTPNDTNAIAIAINNGDESLVRFMMHNQPIRTPEQEKESLRLLAMTASTDRLSVLKDLTTMIPAQSNVRLPVEETALWIAIDSGHADAAMILASWQEPDDRSDDRGRDLLSLASERGLSKVVRKLLGQGLDVGAADNAGRTPTWYAAENGHCRLMLMLTDHNADIDQSDIDGHTPLIRAVVAEQDECVAIAIAARSNVDHQTRTGNTALIMAARDRPQSLRLLLAADADVSIRNEASFTALMTAVRERCIECISYLIRAGANPRRQNSQGQNSYDIAAGDEGMLAALER